MGLIDKANIEDEGDTYEIAELRLNPAYLPDINVKEIDSRIVSTHAHDVMLLKTAEDVTYTGK